MTRTVDLIEMFMNDQAWGRQYHEENKHLVVLLQILPDLTSTIAHDVIVTLSSTE